ncbi:MAG TPA: HAD hydrolase-like protein [Gemmatimonadaceae bacterium]|nr:HAD hydrolase-like protein [Gemmatimonadaceae bacterium]
MSARLEIDAAQAIRVADPVPDTMEEITRRAIAPVSGGQSPHAVRTPFRTRLPLEARRLLRARRRRAAIFALEGSLVDSQEARVLAWLVAMHDCGYDVSLELLRPLMGMGPGELIPTATGLSANSEEARRILVRQAQVFQTWYLPRLLPFVGTRRLLHRMKRDGMRTLAVVSTSGQEAAELLRASSAGDLLDDVITAGDDAPNATFAHALETAVARSGCGREGAVLIGNSPFDVAVGRRVGIGVVALRSGGWSTEALQGAVAIYEDVQDLLARYGSSPFGSADTRHHDRELDLVH